MDDAAAKPLDVGTGAVCASFDLSSAAWLSIGAPHAVHGFVELSALRPFDEARRGDPIATRQHRAAMTGGESAFLAVEIDGARPVMAADLSEPVAPRWSAEGVEVRMGADLPDTTTIRQAWSIGAGPKGPRSVAMRLRGRLDRPAAAEITEINPPPPTGASTRMRLDDRCVLVEASSLPAQARVDIRGVSVDWRIRDGELLGIVKSANAAPVSFEIAVTLLTDVPTPAPSVAAPSRSDADPMTRRALAYIRGCTALAVDVDERTILTDHRILPLSWTRDAYWQALALLAADAPGDRERVGDHLRWLWRRCERPDGRWVRSHHANGHRKDLAFQADQQLYPLVELADYWRLAGTLPAGVDWDEATAVAWDAAVEEIHAETGLIASAENAADDPAAAPFIASSQILVWYAAERVAELAEAGAIRIDAAAIRRTGAAVRSSFVALFSHDGDPWPYAVDGEGTRIAYHDANDLPVAFAPLWGFCDRDDPGWSATMTFAFGDDNPAWCGGPRPGLGSTHTAGPWTLGNIQAWVRARTMDDGVAMRESLARLHEVAFVDGMLPEAYAADPTHDRRIRQWFAWPGAALASLVLLDRDGRLEERLSAQRTG